MSRTGHILPEAKTPKLIVVAAFNRDEEGDLKPADPRQMQSEDAAVRFAKAVENQHAGVIAWRREANPAIGEYGEPTILYQAGEVSYME